MDGQGSGTGAAADFRLAATLFVVQFTTTILSTGGTPLLPRAIRQRRQWGSGRGSRSRTQVEDTPDGVLLKAAPVFASTRPEDVFGSAKRRGSAIRPGDMDAAIVNDTKRRRARDQCWPCRRIAGG